MKNAVPKLKKSWCSSLSCNLDPRSIILHFVAFARRQSGTIKRLGAFSRVTPTLVPHGTLVLSDDYT
jgi:hypothetical protein